MFESFKQKIISPIKKIGERVYKTSKDFLNKPAEAMTEEKRREVRSQVGQKEKVQKIKGEVQKKTKEAEKLASPASLAIETIKGTSKAKFQVGEFLAKIPAYVGAKVGVSLARMPGQIYRGTASLIDKKPRRIIEEKPITFPWIGEVSSYAYDHSKRVNEIIEGKDIDVLGIKIPWQARALFPFFEIPLDVLWTASGFGLGKPIAKSIMGKEKYFKSGFNKSFKLLKTEKIYKPKYVGTKKYTEKELTEGFVRQAEFQIRRTADPGELAKVRNTGKNPAADIIFNDKILKKSKSIDDALKRIEKIVPEKMMKDKYIHDAIYNYYNSAKQSEKVFGIKASIQKVYKGSKIFEDLNLLGNYFYRNIRKAGEIGRGKFIEQRTLKLHNAALNYHRRTKRQPEAVYAVLGALGIGAGAEEIGNPFKV